MEAQMFQLFFNVGIALIGFLGGWMVTSINKRLDNQDTRMHSMSNKVQAIEVVLAGTYVKREDLEKLGNSIFTKLDIISAKLDTKLDKP